MKNRYKKASNYFKRELTDICVNLIHKIMCRRGFFDYIICNNYDEISREKILTIVGGRQNDSGR